MGKGKVAKSISLGICSQRRELKELPIRQKGEWYMMEVWFRADFHVNICDKEASVLATSSAHGA